MPRVVLYAIAIVALTGAARLAFAAQPHQQQGTWELTRGASGTAAQWTPIENAPAAQDRAGAKAPVPALEDVERLIEQKKYREAEKQAIRWVLANKDHPQRDRGLYLIAASLYHYGDRIRAFYYCDELLDTYPASAYYTPALELQYRIADAYLDGYKRRFFRIPMFHAHDEAIEMLFRIQHRSPGSQLAERALLRTANFYYHDGQYDFAGDTYGAYLRTYPRSPITPRVRLRQAYSIYAQFKGPRFDATPAIDAREQLRELIAQYPELAREEKLPELLVDIDRTLAQKLYVTADFYRRTDEPRGAAYTYRYLVKAYPQTEVARQAEAALEQLPSWALASVPEPAIMPAYAPATPPTLPRIVPAGDRDDRPSVFEQPAQPDRPTFR